MFNRWTRVLRGSGITPQLLDHPWRTLRGPQKTETTLVVKYAGDIHPIVNGPTFPNVVDVTLYRCDKIFVYYWLTPTTFPSVKRIYLLSHPCEPIEMCNPHTTEMFVGTIGQSYVARWGPDDEWSLNIYAMRGESDEAVLHTQTYVARWAPDGEWSLGIYAMRGESDEAVLHAQERTKHTLVDEVG